MSWNAVAFTTPEYEHFVPTWEQMVRQLGGEPLIIRLPSKGGHEVNCGLKPQALVSARAQVQGPFFYLDVDTQIIEAPTFPSGNWDVGLMTNRVTTHRNRTSAASIFFNDTQGARTFLHTWANYCAAHPGKDHGWLTRTIATTARTTKHVDASRCVVWVPNGLHNVTSLAAQPIPLVAVSAGETGTVWYAIPSVRPCHEAMLALSKWKERGYKVAVQRDPGADSLPVDLVITRPYAGYADAVNHLAKEILRIEPAAKWIITGGDDLHPDQTANPAVVAQELEAHFSGTFGVMQPTGDRHLPDKQGVCAPDRCCISPWMGRQWCEQAYEGKGPLHAGYFHCFVDEELHVVAKKLGRLWQRRDLNQYHAWWSREGKPQPTHLNPTRIKWEKDKALFNARCAKDFPGSSRSTPLYVGYYTEGAYERDAIGLIEALNALELPHEFIKIESGSTWQQITQRKALIIQEAMCRHPDRPLVYLDVDCLVIKRPTVFDTLKCDVAASMFGGVLLSGTLYFGPTAAAKQVVADWITLNKKYPVTLPNGSEAWDQRTLQMVLDKKAASFVSLPPEYTYMIGLSQIKYPDVNPIILHTRGSLRHNPEHT